MIKTIFAAGVTLFGGSAAFGGTDTPITPIDSTTIETVMISGLFDETCLLYGQVIPLFTSVLDGDMMLAMNVTDAYAISMFETGVDPTQSSRLTAEAREMFIEYIHGCI